MKNKNRVLFILLLLAVLIAAILFYTNKLGTIQQELKDFAIQDEFNQGNKTDIEYSFVDSGINPKRVTAPSRNTGIQSHAL